MRQALLDKGDDAAAKIEIELGNVDAGLHGLHEREANIRAGYVYVISNLGAFGPRMVKIGMTRRQRHAGEVLEYVNDAEALEYRQSHHTPAPESAMAVAPG